MAAGPGEAPGAGPRRLPVVICEAGGCEQFRRGRCNLWTEGTRLVYKHLATLYFIFVFDSSENELAMLDLVQVFVETLNRCFKNVCELDIVFNFNKLHTVLDEMILGGQVIETSSEQIMKSVEEIARLEKQSSTTSLIPKSISERFSR
uniref:AP complex mu/sigma subunit domain-containing protein n=1 Tax=Aegilops tauschii subsp. strangulata TaxID=200361 RepID=A0A453IKE6_AEGTS